MITKENTTQISRRKFLQTALLGSFLLMISSSFGFLLKNENIASDQKIRTSTYGGSAYGA
jgi:hypothetical protein